MIDILFLKRPEPLPFNLSGLEYLDWQAKSTVFNELKTVLTASYDAAKKEFDFTSGTRNTIAAIIKKNLKMTVNIVVDEFGPAVDTGYLLPGHVFNHQGIEKWVGKEYTKFSEAFKDLKKDVIKGWADPKTGTLEGEFQNIPFSLYLGPSLGQGLSESVLLKYKTTVPEAMAAFILHECGHIYAGLLYVSSRVIDNALISQATKMYLNTSDTVRRTTILKEALGELGAMSDVPTAEMDEEEVTVFFNKNVVNRDYRRSLSLGVAEMSFEVLADAYASRFGASHQLVSGLAALGYTSHWASAKIIGFISVLFSIFLAVPFIPIFMIGMMSYFIGFGVGSTISDIYDAPYRRMKTVLRDCTAEMSQATYPRSEKVKRLQELRKMDEMVEENKTYLESTAFQRTMGWVLNGSDFRKSDFENYTADLVSTRLALYSQNYFSE